MVIDNKQLIYYKLIIKSILDSIERRFFNSLSLITIEADNAAIAAFSHTKFKNKWLNCIHTFFREQHLSIFKKTVTAESRTTTSREDFEIQEDH